MIVTTGARGFSLLGLVLDVQFDLLDRGVDDAAAAFAFFNFETETVFRANFLRDHFVDRLVDVRENAHLHQVGDELERLLLSCSARFAHDDRRLDRDHFARGISAAQI